MSKNNLKSISDLFLDPIDQDSINKAVDTLLSSIGEDPNRQGLQGTPDRIARMYAEIFDGYGTDPDKLINDA